MWVPNGDEDKPKWYLVVASCKTMKEAEDYIKDKKLGGAEILKGRNGMYRISVANGSFREIKFLKNPEVASSNPAPATKWRRSLVG